MSKYDDIPASACTFAAPVEMGDNGDDSTSAPFELLARSSKAIFHPYWGNVIHDMEGAFGKQRIPIDFDHDEAIGFANKRRTGPDGMHLSGALVSVTPGDRADTVMKQARAGIPFEASINFGGEGIKLEEVPAGQFVEVNGMQFTDGVIIRSFPIRGCAFTLYGADGNTNTNVFSSADTTFSAQIITPNMEVTQMAQPENTSASPAPAELAQVEAVEAQEELATTELSQAVEVEVAEAVEPAVEAEEAEAEVVEPVMFSQDDLVKMVTEFGQEIAMQTVTNGGNYADACALHQEAKDAELESLRAENAELKASQAVVTGAQPASFSANDAPGKPAKKNIKDAAVRRTN